MWSALKNDDLLPWLTQPDPSRCIAMGKSEKLTHPDGKWSPPRPRHVSGSKLTYESFEWKQIGRHPSGSNLSFEGRPIDPAAFRDDFFLSAENDQQDLTQCRGGSPRARLPSAEVEVAGSCDLGRAGEFDIQLFGVAGLSSWRGTRSQAEIEALRRDLRSECGWGMYLPFLPFQVDSNQMPTMLPEIRLHKLGSELQAWFEEVIVTPGPATSNALDSFLGLVGHSSSSYSNTQCEELSLLDMDNTILSEIMNFLGHPKDIVRTCTMSSKSVDEASRAMCARHWERLYCSRWPAFYDAQVHCVATRGEIVDWKKAYCETYSGEFQCVLEVYEREKKKGFIMSCMSAVVVYHACSNSFTANYVSASYVAPENIPFLDRRRLRFCPSSARAQLRPLLMPEEGNTLYSHRILEGTESIKAGAGVELQWKMQRSSPFGWWFGTAESVETVGDIAKVTMIFKHFPAASRWYRVTVTVGDGVTRDCPIGGYHGGMRVCTEAESRDWMQFFPKEPVIF